MNEEVGLGYADIDLNLMYDIRNRLPSVCHKRIDLYWFYNYKIVFFIKRNYKSLCIFSYTKFLYYLRIKRYIAIVS